MFENKFFMWVGVFSLRGGSLSHTLKPLLCRNADTITCKKPSKPKSMQEGNTAVRRIFKSSCCCCSCC